MKTHLEKIMTIEGFCEMDREDCDMVFLFLMGKLRQPIVAGQHVCVADSQGKAICETYIAGITIGSDSYSKVHKQADKGEQVQLIVGTNFKKCPELKTNTKYLCAVIYD